MVLLRGLTYAFLLANVPGIYGLSTTRACESPQYVEVGTTGTVRCDFHQIYAAYWYETTESDRNPPVINYVELKKSGSGFQNGEYDVHPDGSLIIKNATFQHEATFRVIFLPQRDGIPSREDIRVVVTVRPAQTFPVITDCEGKRTCFKQLPSNTPVSCAVKNTKPAVNLSWVERTRTGDIPISSSRDESNANNLFTIVRTIDESNFNGHSLLLLICKSGGTPSLLLNNESAILLQNLTHATSYEEIVVKNAASGSSLLLPCNDTESLVIAWNRGDDDERVTVIAKASHDKFPIVNEYDTTSDGALVIQKIRLDHEGMYQCTYSDGNVEGVIAYQVIVHVLPIQSYPIIEECGQERFCNRQLKSNYVLRCIVRDARPPANLGWYRRTTNALEKIPSSSHTSQNDELYTSYEDTIVTFDTTYISVLVCQSLDEPPLLSIKDSLILIEDVNKNISFTNPVTKYVQQHSNLELECGSTQRVYTIWKKKSSDGTSQTILFVSLEDTETINDAYYIKGDHDLAVDDVPVQHGGTYICIYGDGRKEYEKSYNAIVYINPEPNYLEVIGCGSQQYCVLKTQRKDNITCSVRGVRPAVDLEWTTVEQKQRDVIQFTNQKILKSSNGETFDIQLTSSFAVDDLYSGRMTVACRTGGPNGKLFDLQTTLDLMFTQGNDEQKFSGSPFPWIILALLLVGTVIALVILIIYFRRHRKEKEYQQSVPKPEEVKMISPPDFPDGGMEEIHEDDKRNFRKSKKEQFIEELKDKYKIWASSIRPLPSYGTKLQFEVNDIFVNGGIKILAPRRKGMLQDEWNPVKSYHDIFKMNSTRIIVEGDPGFGKSTMMLKAAYDWSTKCDQSPLKDTDIFIFLQLSKLGGIQSLYSAIRKTLLPKESQLNKRDIEKIVLGTENVVLAFDDFDEYPDRESKAVSDFMSIIAGDMLNKITVILLTRTTYLPSNFRPDTQFVRLTGFNRTVQDLYITKAFGSTEMLSADTMKPNPDINTIMNDIARVPMFFTMFAHVKNLSGERSNLASATQFFQYVIDEIESRLNEKFGNNDPKYSRFTNDDYMRIGDVALQAFSNKKPLIWTRQILMNRIGEDTCIKFLAVGILVQEDNGILVSKTSNKISRKEIKFYHTLFCEWYAAKVLVKRLEKRDYEKILNKLNPFDLQYLYRFTCGLNISAGNKIISYLQSGENGDKFAIICELEKTGKVEDIRESVTKMCSSIVSIFGGGSRLLRKSIALLLEIASKIEIPIESVLLDRCVRADEEYPEHLAVGPDSFIPPLTTLTELRIYNVGQHLSQSLNDHILTYCFQCGNVRNLQFLKTFQPKVVLSDEPDILLSLQSMQITVTWTPLKEGPRFLLDLQSGTWKDQENGQELTEDDHSALLEEFNQLWNPEKTS